MQAHSIWGELEYATFPALLAAQASWFHWLL
jgi:hypothetical protein